MTFRAVLDTSTLVAPRLRRELQQAAQLGAFTGIWSPWIIAELNRVLTWRWIRHPRLDDQRTISQTPTSGAAPKPPS